MKVVFEKEDDSEDGKGASSKISSLSFSANPLASKSSIKFTSSDKLTESSQKRPKRKVRDAKLLIV